MVEIVNKYCKQKRSKMTKLEEIVSIYTNGSGDSD